MVLASMVDPSRDQKLVPTSPTHHHKSVSIEEHGMNRFRIETIELKADLQPDMVILADAFRLDATSRLVLTAFDARTLEDFCMMTNEDFDLMVISAARTGYNLAPLQQRKISVLLEWIRRFVKEESVLLNNCGRSVIRGMVTEKSVEECYVDVPLVPPNWESRFQEDLPALKQRLVELGETTQSSGFALLFTTVRWAFCLN